MLRLKTIAIVVGAIAALGLALAASYRGTAVQPSTCSGGASPCPKVLFIGNSYTYVNDLPDTFAKLAISGGHPVATGMLAFSNATLAQHAKSPDTSKTLSSTKWNFVVLQEQSLLPLSITPSQSAAHAMVAKVRESRAEPILFMTPARNEDWNLTEYRADQDTVQRWYSAIGDLDRVTVAPAGIAWREAVRRVGPERLWAADGSHPSEGGTYLHACVFYATIFHQSPVGIGFVGALPREEAVALQKIAANAALGSD